MKLNSFVLSSAALLLGTHAFAATQDTIIYYSGTEVRTSLNGGPQIVEELLLKKSLLPGLGMITEMACTRSPGAPAQASPAYMNVVGDRIIQISDREDFLPGALSGTGALEGPSWAWNYLKFSMIYRTGQVRVRIEDENWVSGPYIVALKELFLVDSVGGQDRKISMLTAKAREITQSEYETRFRELGCP